MEVSLRFATAVALVVFSMLIIERRFATHDELASVEPRMAIVRSKGFTLIELMVTVAILGVLGAIAIPAFTSYISRAKTGEAATNLNNMFKGAASYYSGDWAKKGMTSNVTGYCTVGDGGPMPLVPKRVKQPFSAAGEPSFRAIHFLIADFVYYSYSLTSVDVNGACGHGKDTPKIYTFSANGDLNQDGKVSSFQIVAGSNADNVLYHGRGIYIGNELE
jgi:prepilin-type N-terminal cleavage/methylation domain-containing protein